MPSRYIKESIRTSYEIDSLSSEAENTFYRLITYADDWGRFHVDPRILKSQLYPLRDSLPLVEIEKWVSELLETNLIKLYIGEDGRSYGFFVSWKKYQSVRNIKSKFPDPNGKIFGKFKDFCDELKTIENNCMQLSPYSYSYSYSYSVIGSAKNSREFSTTPPPTKKILSTKITKEILHDYPEEIKNLARLFYDTLPNTVRKDFTKRQLFSWLGVFEKLIRIDNYNHEQISRIILYFRSEKFWKKQFLTPHKLRRRDKEGVMYVTRFWNELKEQRGIIDQADIVAKAEKLRESLGW